VLQNGNNELREGASIAFLQIAQAPELIFKSIADEGA
jgi:hypothetical protein